MWWWVDRPWRYDRTCCLHLQARRLGINVKYSIFWVIPGLMNLCARVSQYSVCSISIILVHSTYEDGVECSETSEHKIQTPGNHPKDRIQH